MTGLAGKVALVTGAGQGIGRAVALVLAERGADVVISGRTESKLAAVAEEIRSMGAPFAVSVGDVGVRTDATSMVETAATTFDGLDILVNNAQTSVNGVKVADIDDHTLDTVFGSGARGTLYAMQAALRSCLPEAVVALSISGRRRRSPVIRRSAAYVMTKEAIRGLSRVAAREWGRYNSASTSCAPPR